MLQSPIRALLSQLHELLHPRHNVEIEFLDVHWNFAVKTIQMVLDSAHTVAQLKNLLVHWHRRVVHHADLVLIQRHISAQIADFPAQNVQLGLLQLNLHHVLLPELRQPQAFSVENVLAHIL